MKTPSRSYILLISLITIAIFGFIYLLKYSTAFYIFAARDYERALALLEGNLTWLGPEMSRFGRLPGPLAYVLNAVPLSIDRSWQSVFYFGAVLNALAGAYFFTEVLKRFGKLTALVALSLYLSTPLGPLAALMNAHPAYLVVLNPIILFLVAGRSDELSRTKWKFRLGVLLIAVAMQLHFSAVLWLPVYLTELHLRRARFRDYAELSVLFLLPMLPMWFNSTGINPTLQWQDFREFALRLFFGEEGIARHNLSDFVDLVLRIPSYLIIVFVLVAIHIYRGRGKELLESSPVKHFAVFLFVVLIAVFSGRYFESRYLLVPNILTVFGIAVLFEKVTSTFNSSSIRLVLALFFCAPILKPVSLVFRSNPIEITQGIACDKEYAGEQSLTSAATLEKISEIVRERTDWSYDDFLERTVLVGFDEVNVGFRPIFEQKNSSAKISNLPAGLIMINREFLCRGDSQTFIDLLPVDLRKLFESKKLTRSFEVTVADAVLVFYSANETPSENFKFQNIGFAYGDLARLHHRMSATEDQVGPGELKLLWNDCRNHESDCQSSFVGKIENNGEICRLSYRIYSKHLSYNESLYSDGPVGFYEKMELVFKSQISEPYSVELSSSLGYSPKNKSNFLRSPLSNSIVIPCPPADLASVTMRLGGGGVCEATGGLHLFRWRDLVPAELAVMF